MPKRRWLAIGRRETGLAGVLGGVVAAAWGGAVSVVPPEAAPLWLVFAVGYLAVTLAAFACVGLVVALADEADDLPRLASAGVAGVVVALVLLSAGAVAGVVAPATATVFVTPGIVAALVGLVSSAVAGWRGGLLPRWRVALVAVGAVAFLLFRPAGPPAALLVPLGVGWALVGAALRRSG